MTSTQEGFVVIGGLVVTWVFLAQAYVRAYRAWRAEQHAKPKPVQIAIVQPHHGHGHRRHH